MPTLLVDGITFVFPGSWEASKYDEWSFYRNRWCNVYKGRDSGTGQAIGIKAIDLIAVDPAGPVWFVEVKDYRVHRRTKPSDLGEEVAQKVFDTLAALLPASVNGDVPSEIALARRALGATRLRVVLHLEQPAKHSKLFPRAIEPANVVLKLKSLLKPIDAHPLVVECARMHGVAWHAR